jgi:hypothetical protein
MSKPIAALWALLLLTSRVDAAFQPNAFGSGGAGAVGNRAPHGAEAGKPAATEGWLSASRAPQPTAHPADGAPDRLFSILPAFRRTPLHVRPRAAIARAWVVSVRGPPTCLSEFLNAFTFQVETNRRDKCQEHFVGNGSLLSRL